MRPKRPSTMSLKLIAMVVVRKKMEKVMMMVCVCWWHEMRGKKKG